MGFVSPNSRDFWKMCHWTNFEIYPIYRGFFDFFRHFMHSFAIKSSTFTKLGDFSLKYRNFSKILAPAAPKMCHLTQFFPKKFQKFPFFGAFGAEKCVTEHPNWPPLLAIGPLNCIPGQHAKGNEPSLRSKLYG